MKTQFDLLKTTRNNILELTKELNIAQVNTIPKNYNNSIGWQVAHIVVTQQLLTYKLANQKTLIPEQLITNFKKGSSGKQNLSIEEWQEIKQLLLSLPLQLIEDYNNHLFQGYADYPTSYNYIITSIESAIAFNNIHEAMHFGTISAMKRLI